MSVTSVEAAIRGWVALQRARLALWRHPELGEVSGYCFYATTLRFRDLAFDIGANHGEHTSWMLTRGARVVAVEPQGRLAAGLAARFPTATVLRSAVSNKPGTAVLHHFLEGDQLASLDPGWGESQASGRGSSEDVPVTTLDGLIGAYGEPVLVKIDTEGLDHLVLQGLSRPIRHILFEVHANRRDDAAAAFKRLGELGSYGYRLSSEDSWRYEEKTPEEILWALPSWGNVYARLQ